jgi:hypothetical protein
MRLYKLERFDTASPTLTRVNVHPESDVALAHHLAFFREPQHSWGLISATEEGHVQFLDLSSTLTSCSTLSRDSLGLTSGVSHLQCSHEMIAVVADYSGHIVSLDLKNRRVLARMPKYDSSAEIAALSLSAERSADHLVVVYSDHVVHECKARSGKFTRFSAERLSRLEPSSWHRHRPFCTKGVVQDVSGHAIIAYDEEAIYVIDRDHHDDPQRQSNKLRRKGQAEKEEPLESDQHPVRVLKKYRYLVHLDQLADGSLVAVEVQPGSLEEQLPPSLKIKKFGLM